MSHAKRVELFAPAKFPIVKEGDDLAHMIVESMQADGQSLCDDDVVVIAQKVVSKSEGRRVDLNQVTPSAEANDLAARVHKDPRIVHVILSESKRVVRWRPGVLIMEHRLGMIMANAGVDQSNVAPAESGAEYVLLLPKDPDRSAAALRARLEALTGRAVSVVINDSFGRPWRIGTCGVAIGVAGLPALIDRRGDVDLFGRALHSTVIGFADEIAAAASLLMGQAAEGVPVVIARGLSWTAPQSPATSIVRPEEQNLFG